MNVRKPKATSTPDEKNGKQRQTGSQVGVFSTTFSSTDGNEKERKRAITSSLSSDDRDSRPKALPSTRVQKKSFKRVRFAESKTFNNEEENVWETESTDNDESSEPISGVESWKRKQLTSTRVKNEVRRQLENTRKRKLNELNEPPSCKKKAELSSTSTSGTSSSNKQSRNTKKKNTTVVKEKCVSTEERSSSSVNVSKPEPLLASTRIEKPTVIRNKDIEGIYSSNDFRVEAREVQHLDNNNNVSSASEKNVCGLFESLESDCDREIEVTREALPFRGDIHELEEPLLPRPQYFPEPESTKEPDDVVEFMEAAGVQTPFDNESDDGKLRVFRQDNIRTHPSAAKARVKWKRPWDIYEGRKEDKFSMGMFYQPLLPPLPGRRASPPKPVYPRYRLQKAKELWDEFKAQNPKLFEKPAPQEPTTAHETHEQATKRKYRFFVSKNANLTSDDSDSDVPTKKRKREEIAPEAERIRRKKHPSKRRQGSRQRGKRSSPSPEMTTIRRRWVKPSTLDRPKYQPWFADFPFIKEEYKTRHLQNPPPLAEGIFYDEKDGDPLAISGESSDESSRPRANEAYSKKKIPASSQLAQTPKDRQEHSSRNNEADQSSSESLHRTHTKALNRKIGASTPAPQMFGDRDENHRNNSQNSRELETLIEIPSFDDAKLQRNAKRLLPQLSESSKLPSPSTSSNAIVSLPSKSISIVPKIVSNVPYNLRVILKKIDRK